MKYPQMTEEEIKALPREEQKYAYRANPELSVGHYDCQCPKCKRRYSANVRRTSLKRLQCPHCNEGKLFAPFDEHRDGSWCALLRAQGEERPHCQWRSVHSKGGRLVVETYKEGLPQYEETGGAA